MMTPSPPRIMPVAMQIIALQRIFKNLNPEIGIDLIDWSNQVDPTLTLPENRFELSIIYPPYQWFTDETETRDVKRQAIEEYKDYLEYLLETAILPDAREEMKKVFDDSLSNYTLRMTRNLTISKLKRANKLLAEKLEKTPRTQKEVAERETKKIKMETERPKIRMTKDLERKLRDTFEATFTREGMSPKRYMAEYRVELEEIIKGLPTEEEMKKAVEELAKEIIRREQALKIKPPRARPPTERPPTERRIGLPPEEERFFIAAEIPTVELPAYPEKPFKTALYPNRLLTKSEIDDIWDAYRMAVYMCGKNPDRYRRQFEDWMETYLFTSWDQVKSNYASLIAIICEEKKITLIPRAPPAEVIDELVHWITSVNTIKDTVDNKTIKRKPKTIEEVIDKLEEMGKTGVPRSDVIAAIKRGWEEKAPNYIIVTKEYLETLIGEPLD